MHVKRTLSWNPQAYASFWINQASRLLMWHFERALRPLGFGMASLPVVMALEENGPMLQRDLAAAARVEQPTMAALLGRMERDGLIEREPHPEDRRASLIKLTAKAKRRVPEGVELLKSVADRAVRGFTQEEHRTFLALLERVVANLGAEDEEA